LGLPERFIKSYLRCHVWSLKVEDFGKERMRRKVEWQENLLRE